MCAPITNYDIDSSTEFGRIHYYVPALEEGILPDGIVGLLPRADCSDGGARLPVPSGDCVIL